MPAPKMLRDIADTCFNDPGIAIVPPFLISVWLYAGRVGFTPGRGFCISGSKKRQRSPRRGSRHFNKSGVAVPTSLVAKLRLRRSA
jgi:hypothetical protein